MFNKREEQLKRATRSAGDTSEVAKIDNKQFFAMHNIKVKTL